MLGVKNYTRDYVDACRAKFETDTADFEAVRPKASAAFEHAYFGNLLMLLDFAFVHRLRTVEGKDGNPLNEVRVIANSLLQHGGTMTPEANIKLVPAKSVLGIEPGAKIEVTASAFARIRDAYFGEIEKRFV